MTGCKVRLLLAFTNCLDENINQLSDVRCEAVLNRSLFIISTLIPREYLEKIRCRRHRMTPENRFCNRDWPMVCDREVTLGRPTRVLITIFIGWLSIKTTSLFPAMNILKFFMYPLLEFWMTWMRLRVAQLEHSMLTCQRHESETKQHPPKNHRWASPFSSLVRFKTDNFHLCFFIKKTDKYKLQFAW